MLSSFIIISKNNKRNAGEDLYEECNAPSNLLKNCNITNPKCQDYNKTKEGPNINLKCFKKTYDTVEEKSYITQKIRTKKKTELCKNWAI